MSLVRDALERALVYEMTDERECVVAPVDIVAAHGAHELARDEGWLYLAYVEGRRVRRAHVRLTTLGRVPVGATILLASKRGEDWGLPRWRACVVLARAASAAE